MATIRSRNGRYTALVRKSGHPSLSKTFSSKRKAEQWASGMESRIGEGESFETNKYTLADAIDRYKEDPDRSLGSYQLNMLDWWKNTATNRKGMYLGKKQLSSLRRADFIEARDELRKLKGRQGALITPATVNRRMSAVSAVLTEAQQWDWITENIARVRRLEGENERDRLLTPVEQKRLLKAAKAVDEPHMYAFIVCAMLSGARAGELVGLRWKDVDLEKGMLRLLNTKNGSNRPAPLRGHGLDLLQEIRAEQKVTDLLGDDFVFKNKTGHSPFYYNKAWVVVREKARLDDFRFHDLRHLAASHLAMAGATQRELMEVLGHTSAQMTKRYSHFFDSHIADLGDRLQDRLFGGTDD